MRRWLKEDDWRCNRSARENIQTDAEEMQQSQSRPLMISKILERKEPSPMVEKLRSQSKEKVDMLTSQPELRE